MFLFSLLVSVFLDKTMGKSTKKTLRKEGPSVKHPTFDWCPPQTPSNRGVVGIGPYLDGVLFLGDYTIEHAPQPDWGRQ